MPRNVIGEIDTYPYVSLNVRVGGAEQEIRFVLDTGFNGELAIPPSLQRILGSSHNSFEAEFADGERKTVMVTQCELDWLDGPMLVTAMHIGGSNPLIGMELPADCLVTLEIRGDSGEVTIERVD